MNAIQVLKEQHREVETMFKGFERASELERKVELFNALADALALHATIEEKVFYPAVKLKDTEGLLQEAVQEHLQAKQIIAEILEDEENLDAVWMDDRVSTLEESVLHHVEEEENELFPKVQRLFVREELEQIGEEMERLYVDLMDEEAPRSRIPAEADQPAPLL
jgi:hemerythrin-like domain-containing protein